ncbi:hypothetical protein [Aeribacillus sp. FSL K6-2833]|uniref:hypothetical protein n=1 Tax=Aeribacillus sp. FSL K6-2833 TaxID=2954611 RepID=UPI0030DD59F1
MASEKQSRSGLLTSDINRAMFNEISTIRQDPSIWKCEEERFESKKLAFTVQKTELKFLEYKEKLGTDILFRVNGLKLYTIISDLELIESVTMNLKLMNITLGFHYLSPA